MVTELKQAYYKNKSKYKNLHGGKYLSNRHSNNGIDYLTFVPFIDKSIPIVPFIDNNTPTRMYNDIKLYYRGKKEIKPDLLTKLKFKLYCNVQLMDGMGDIFNIKNIIDTIGANNVVDIKLYSTNTTYSKEDQIINNILKLPQITESTNINDVKTINIAYECISSMPYVQFEHDTHNMYVHLEGTVVPIDVVVTEYAFDEVYPMCNKGKSNKISFPEKNTSENITTYIECFNDEFHNNYKSFLITGLAPHNAGIKIFKNLRISNGTTDHKIICNYDNVSSIFKFIIIVRLYMLHLKLQHVKILLFTKIEIDSTLMHLFDFFKKQLNISIDKQLNIEHADYLDLVQNSNRLVGTRGDSDNVLSEFISTEKIIIPSKRVFYGIEYKEKLIKYFVGNLYDFGEQELSFIECVKKYDELVDYISDYNDDVIMKDYEPYIVDDHMTEKFIKYFVKTLDTCRIFVSSTIVNPIFIDTYSKYISYVKQNYDYDNNIYSAILYNTNHDDNAK